MREREVLSGYDRFSALVREKAWGTSQSQTGEEKKRFSLHGVRGAHFSQRCNSLFSWLSLFFLSLSRLFRVLVGAFFFFGWRRDCFVLFFFFFVDVLCFNYAVSTLITCVFYVQRRTLPCDVDFEYATFLRTNQRS